MIKRRRLVGILCSLLAVAALDVGLGRFALQDGEFLGRPVPPYGDVREPRWQAWAKHRMEWLSAGRESTQASVHDPLLGWTNARNFRSPDGTQTFDSRGLRGTREFTELPAEGVQRIALFGESFVLGEEVADGEEFAARMSELEPTFEVMNYGVSGFGTDQALMRFRSEGVNAHANVVGIGVMLENIVRNVSRFTRLRNPYVKTLGVKPRFRLEHGALVLVPSPFPSELDVCKAVFAGTLPEDVRADDAFAEPRYDSWVWKSAFARLYLGFEGSRARDYRRAWLDEHGEAFELLCALLQAFDTEARAAGARRVLVIVFPPKEDLDLVLGGGERFWSGLSKFLEQRHIEMLDCTDALVARAKELAAGKPASSASVFLRAHFNREGNEAVARALAAVLRPP